jgi:ABC-type nitrate/sulfonate/bicarbonate transport system ATPase subunit
MNAKGNIYVQGWEEERKQLKHSSLLAGSGVLCAGTIRINAGKVLWLTGKSGHYRPTVMNVVYLLEKLSQYQVDLKPVKVFRENFSVGFQREDNSQWAAKMGLKNTHVPGKNFESCEATYLLTMRRWPGQDPQSMRVG